MDKRIIIGAIALVAILVIVSVLLMGGTNTPKEKEPIVTGITGLEDKSETLDLSALEEELQKIDGMIAELDEVEQFLEENISFDI